MKNVIIFLAFLICSLKASAQLVVEYNFEAPCNYFACTTDNCHGRGSNIPSFIDGSVLASATPFNLGPGLVASSLTCGGSQMNAYAAGNPGNPSRARWASDWTTSSVVNPNADYFSFFVTAQPFYLLQMTLLTAQTDRSTTGPTLIQARTSADSFTTPVVFATNTGTGWINRSTAGLPIFSGTIEIRIYGYGNSAGISAGSLRIDNVRLHASVILTNLPVELISFTGKVSGETALLEWSTASELNNSHFKVMRSSDAVNFEEIGRVTGVGTTQQSVSYEFVDGNPLNGINYYKLVQVDFNQTETATETVTVNFDRFFSLYHVGDFANMDEERSVLVDNLGRIVSDNYQTKHFLNNSGTFFLRGESGRVKRIVVTN